MRTKIFATISDNRCDISFIKSLYDNGINAVRINTAHIDYDSFKTIVNNVRSVSPSIEILIDTKGPEIRTTSTDNNIEIKFSEGDIITIIGNPEGITSHDKICVSYPDLADKIAIGTHLLLDDGFLEFEVINIVENNIYAKSLNNGYLGSRKSVNIPGTNINLPSLTPRDITNIEYAVELGVDYIAHSFVRTPKDVLAVKEQLIKLNNGRIKIIAKIENQEGVNNIDNILDIADGALIARGDLGVEIAQEKIPTIQQTIITKCANRRKPVILSTQLLHSMIENPRPTRAEVSDIANAVHQHVDALLLTGETAIGKYPTEAVATMVKVINEAERASKELISANNCNNSVEEQLEEYILQHIDPEPQALKQLNRDTHLFHLYSRMCSGHLQGRLLKMFTQMINPHRILELGTFTGYSALCFAEGMPNDAELHTIEIDDEVEDFIRERFDASPYASRMHLHIGDALDIIPTIDGVFDLVFIDANKRNYVEYYELILPRLSQGGYIFADNTLWDGKVADPETYRDAQTQSLLAFNDHVAKDPRVSKVIVPLRDGLTIIRKL